MPLDFFNSMSDMGYTQTIEAVFSLSQYPRSESYP